MKKTLCPWCDSPIAPGDGREPLTGGEPICSACFEAELRSAMIDSFAVDPEDMTLCRRRIEDALRKSPDLVIEIGAMLGARNRIKWWDLI